MIIIYFPVYVPIQAPTYYSNELIYPPMTEIFSSTNVHTNYYHPYYYYFYYYQMLQPYFGIPFPDYSTSHKKHHKKHSNKLNAKTEIKNSQCQKHPISQFSI